MRNFLLSKLKQLVYRIVSLYQSATPPEIPDHVKEKDRTLFKIIFRFLFTSTVFLAATKQQPWSQKLPQNDKIAIMENGSAIAPFW